MQERWLLLGTSNTIRQDGYRRFLARLRPDLDLHMRAVGDSSSLMLPYALDEVALRDVDRVVIDTLVNDATLADIGYADPWSTDRALCEVTLWLRARGLPVCLLLLPHADPSPDARALHRRRRAWATEHDIPHVDGPGILEALARDFGLAGEQLFDDPLHAAWPVTLLLARRLALLDWPKARAATCDAGFPYRIVRMATPEHGHAVTRRTSLLQAQYAILDADTPARLVLDHPATPCALAINRIGCAGRLIVTAGTESVDLDLAREAGLVTGTSREMVHVVTALPPVPPARSITLTVAPGADGSPGRLEVEAVVLRMDQPPRAGQPVTAALRPDPAVPGPVVLGPDEAAVALAASMARGGLVPSRAAELFRTRIAADPPFWTRRPSQASRILVRLGEALGEPVAAGRIRAQAEGAADDTDAPRGRGLRRRRE